MIDAILFDLGDTIINYGIGRAEAEGLFHAGARLTYDHLRERGKPLPTYERYLRAHYWKMRNEYLWSKLVCRDFSYSYVIEQTSRRLRIPLTPPEVHELAWMWYHPIMQASHIDEGVVEMIAGLHAAGTKMAIVSNTFVPGHCMDRHLEQAGLLGYFPVRVYSSSVRYRKPHRRIFEIALEQIGVGAERAIFIGDLIRADIKGARRAGMRTVWKPARHAVVGGKVRHKADWMIRKITQLPEVLEGAGWRADVVEA